MNNLRPYVVRQGDYLDHLAAQHAFVADAVWNHEKNKPLRDKGRLPEILFPGDVLYIPEAKPRWLPVKVGQVNKFTASASLVSISLEFRGRDGKPLPNAACTYRALTNADTAPTTTDGSGALTLKVSTRQPPFSVEFADDAVHFLVLVGHMDPLAEASGVQKRLQNLGFAGAPILAAAELHGFASPYPVMQSALGAFQVAQRSEPTGALDETTSTALQKAHGV